MRLQRFGRTTLFKQVCVLLRGEILFAAAAFLCSDVVRAIECKILAARDMTRSDSQVWTLDLLCSGEKPL
jgi:hypothetical protein